MPLRAATEVRSSVHIAHDLTIAQDDETFRKTLIIESCETKSTVTPSSSFIRVSAVITFRSIPYRGCPSAHQRRAPWSIDQRAGNRNTLLLSAREFRRSMAGAILEIKHREQFPGLQPSLSQGSADMSEGR